MSNQKISTEKHLLSSQVRILLWGASLTTLGIWTTFSDPFNPVKFIFILLTAAWLSGFLFSQLRKSWKMEYFRSIFFVAGSFLLAMLIAVYFTEDKRIAFIGDNQRYNGFLLYLGLATILLVAAQNFRFNNIHSLYKSTILLGSFLSIYGLFQINGRDIVKWNNPYNAVISTVGNPNFAAAIMAIMATLTFGISLSRSFSKLLRVSGLLVCFSCVAAIYFSDARQGLIGLAIGFSVYLAVYIHSINKRFAYVFSSTTFIIGTLSVLGMLQIGPLTSIMYKGSVTVRGYYWRAALEMFESSPFFGVGIDSYGSYFKQFREVGYPLNYGFEITSSNAHNQPLQFFATGGFFLGATYLILLGLTFWRAVRTLKLRQGDQRLHVAAVFAAWLVYHATSLVSIDSPGIAVWGWLLTGAIFGLSTDPDKSNEVKNKVNRANKIGINPVRVIISGTASILVLFLSLVLFRGETNMYHTRSVYNPDIPANATYLKESATKTINLTWVNPIYKITSASYLANSGFATEGIKVLEDIVQADSRSIDALNLLATYYYQLGQIDLAIKKREAIQQLDPWNAKNLLMLGSMYKLSGSDKMEEVREKILAFAAETPEGKQAVVELVS